MSQPTEKMIKSGARECVRYVVKPTQAERERASALLASRVYVAMERQRVEDERQFRNGHARTRKRANAPW